MGAYEEKAEAKKEQMSAKLEELKARAKEATADAKIKIEREIRDIEDRLNMR